MTVTLRGEGLQAEVAPEAGMVVASLRSDAGELLGQRGGLERYMSTGSSFGVPLLYPWANRIDRHDLDPARVPVRLDDHGLPIHGLLAADANWQLTDQSEGSITATLAFDRPELLAAFPYPHDLEVRHELAGGLTTTTTVRAREVEVPVSFGWHPYLRIPGVSREELVLDLPLRERVALDDRGLPVGGPEPYAGGRVELRDRVFDDLFTGVEGPLAVEGGGLRIGVEFGAGYPWAQVYAPAGEDLVALEPMTAPTNALVNGEHPAVEPGGEFVAEFRVSVA